MNAREVSEKLELEQHPEGGWFRETWRADALEGERASATAILMVLENGQKSRWHKVDGAEVWLWHSGNPLMLSLSGELEGAVRRVRLGPDLTGGDVVQHVVDPLEWQSAEALAGSCDYTLMSCIASPGFARGPLLPRMRTPHRSALALHGRSRGTSISSLPASVVPLLRSRTPQFRLDPVPHEHCAAGSRQRRRLRDLHHGSGGPRHQLECWS